VTTGGLLGYAWRDPAAGGRYHYVELGSMPTVASTFAAAAQCAAGNIGAATNGGFLQITPGIPIGGPFISPPVGAPIYLYQRLRYRFAASVTIPGTTALWRDVLRTGASEEIASPLGNGSQFAWFLKSDSQVPVVAAPAALASIAGFKITMNGIYERTAEGAMAPASALVSTSIFFRNRLD
ncbi:MAG: hypothetical protein M3081_14610, partial [Gemmatimonadota bacterium]|nr:hypothetical protein [Gemmatimonadota bacterium]